MIERHDSDPVAVVDKATLEAAVSVGSPCVSPSLARHLLLAVLIGAWYCTNIAFNMYLKRVLRQQNCPFLLSLVCFAVGAILASFSWALRLQAPPALNTSTVRSSFSSATWHTTGCMLTNYCLSGISVAFLQTIKATEPAFAAVLSFAILGSRPSLSLCMSLGVLIFGVALVSFREQSFEVVPFAAGLGSNTVLQLRNVLSKRTMQAGATQPDAASEKASSLFNLMTVSSFFLCLPVAVVLDFKCVASCTAAMSRRTFDIEVSSPAFLLRVCSTHSACNPFRSSAQSPSARSAFTRTSSFRSASWSE